MAKLNSAACRAARALLNLAQNDLARAAGVSATTVNKFEKGEEVRGASVDRIAAFFEAQGVQTWNDDRPGARRR